MLVYSCVHPTAHKYLAMEPFEVLWKSLIAGEKSYEISFFFFWGCGIAGHSSVEMMVCIEDDGLLSLLVECKFAMELIFKAGKNKPCGLFEAYNSRRLLKFQNPMIANY